MVTARLGADFPYQLVTGNHESDGQEGDIEKFVQCLPNRLPGLQGEYGVQWRVDVPEQNPVVRFIMVSPGIDFRDGEPLDYSRDSERWRWTADAIDEAKSQNIPWTVVGMHTPCLSVGNYDCQAGQEFTNMLIEKKVDLVLSGHDHVYQRTHQLATGGGCAELVPASFTAGCLADTDGAMVQGSGTVFATVGVGGVGLYNVTIRGPGDALFRQHVRKEPGTRPLGPWMSWPRRMNLPPGSFPPTATRSRIPSPSAASDPPQHSGRSRQSAGKPPDASESLRPAPRC